MKYRNKKTGAVIEVESKLGGDWELITAPAAQKAEKAEPAKKKVKAKK